MSDSSDFEKQLQKPFEEQDVQWRVQQFAMNQKSMWMTVVPYVTNRAIQKRLDDVFGVFGWENVYKKSDDGKGYLCGITAIVGDKRVTKWDGAEYTNIEPLKGALSDSMKRCAVQFGVGRYLYNFDGRIYANCMVVENRRDAVNLHIHYPQKGNKANSINISWENPKLPSWALPFTDYSEFINKIIESKDIQELKENFANAYRAGESSQSDELIEKSIQAKDKRKAEIMANIEAINEAKYKEVDAWLDQEVLNFDELPSKATVENYKNLVSDKLHDLTSGQPFDPEPLKQKLNMKFNERINKLKR